MCALLRIAMIVFPLETKKENTLMKKFMELFGDKTIGVISGWDRLFFRGTIRWLSSQRGIASYLGCKHMLLKDFGTWASSLTEHIRAACENLGDTLGIRREYLRSSSLSKEERARAIAQEDGIENGPICMFSVVEPCYAPTVVGNRDTKRLELAVRPRKCVWIYFYWNDPELGFGHMRLQTWLPFTIKGCLNGRHWLERQLLAERIPFIKSNNSFRWIHDCERAQQLLDAQLQVDWPALLDKRRRTYFGILDTLFGGEAFQHYWSAESTEWATDIMFRNTTELDRLFPLLARYGLLIGDSANVLRFLGKIAPDAALPQRISGDIRGDRIKRHEGIRVKHWAGANSIKIYNKAGNVLRTETTINATRPFKVYRQANDASQRPPAWLPMRKGVADMQRRSCICQKGNERYLEALAACGTDDTLRETVITISKRTKLNARSVRALHPWGEQDYPVFQFLAQGQWTINGFRNRDLTAWLNSGPNNLSPDELRRRSSRTSQLLRILRAHGLIQKVSKSHRYQLTGKGTQITTTVLLAANVQTQQLTKIAV